MSANVTWKRTKERVQERPFKSPQEFASIEEHVEYKHVRSGRRVPKVNIGHAAAKRRHAR
jgi:hypothetical protein